MRQQNAIEPMTLQEMIFLSRLLFWWSVDLDHTLHYRFCSIMLCNMCSFSSNTWTCLFKIYSWANRSKLNYCLVKKFYKLECACQTSSTQCCKIVYHLVYEKDHLNSQTSYFVKLGKLMQHSHKSKINWRGADHLAFQACSIIHQDRDWSCITMPFSRTIPISLHVQNQSLFCMNRKIEFPQLAREENSKC